MSGSILQGICPADRPLRIVLVGCGGTGSQVLTGLTHLHHALHALNGTGLAVTVFDADTVSEHNVLRQRFAPQDVGHNKAVRLVSRINATYGWQWVAVPDRFPALGEVQADVLISCVDTRAARRAIQQALTRGVARQVAWWLDCGNDRDFGQVVLGQPRNAVNRQVPLRVPTAPELYPALIARGREDDAPSCSAEQSLRRQDLFINALISSAALNLLWRLIRDPHLVWNGQAVNAQQGQSNAFTMVIPSCSQAARD